MGAAADTWLLYDAEPETAEEWLYEKNAGWISNRTSVLRSACPYCASKRVCDDNHLRCSCAHLLDLLARIGYNWLPLAR